MKPRGTYVTGLQTVIFPLNLETLIVVTSDEPGTKWAENGHKILAESHDAV